MEKPTQARISNLYRNRLSCAVKVADYDFQKTAFAVAGVVQYIDTSRYIGAVVILLSPTYFNIFS
jgi:hypothetical protein